MKEEIKNELLAKRQVKGSNALLNAKGTGSLITHKVFFAGMLNMTTDDTNHIVASIPMEELRKIFGVKNKDVYGRVAEIADRNFKGDNLYDWFLYERDDKRQSVESLQVITNAKYENGCLRIRYNESVTKRLQSLQKDFTVFRLCDIYGMKSYYSIRLYELLKTNYDKQRAITKTSGTHVFTYHITELKFQLGIITDEGDKRIKEELGKDYPDFDRIDELLKDKPDIKYTDFRIFNRDVIKKAVAEVNKRTILNVENKNARDGRFVKHIHFYVSYKDETTDTTPENTSNNIDNTEIVEEVNKDEVMDEILKVLLGKFSYVEIKTIVKHANYNKEDIFKAYEYFENYNHDIDNTVAFMRDCITERWFEKGTSKSARKKGSENNFNNYEQRNDYDFDEMEKKLLDN